MVFVTAGLTFAILPRPAHTMSGRSNFPFARLSPPVRWGQMSEQNTPTVPRVDRRQPGRVLSGLSTAPTFHLLSRERFSTPYSLFATVAPSDKPHSRGIACLVSCYFCVFSGLLAVCVLPLTALSI